MKVAFDQRQGISIVPTEFEGPTGTGVLRMALDTGATGTLVNPGPLVALGYDPALCTERVQVTTGSGVEFAPRLIVSSVKAFGRTCRNLAVLGHTLPPSAVVDGLLGLDFFRGTRLEIDFRDGFVRLEA